MSFDDVYLVTKKLDLVFQRDREQLEQQLGLPLRADHSTFFSTLGSGIFCDFIRVFSPKEILDEIIVARQKWKGFPSWDSILEALSSAKLETSILVAESVEGDQIIYCPSHDKLLVLPRGDSNYYWLPEGFRDLMYWVSPNSTITTPTRFQYFQSWIDRNEALFWGSNNKADLNRLVADITFCLPGGILYPQEIRREGQAEVLFFVPDMSARISMLQSFDDEPELTLSINYDIERAPQFEALTENLLDFGFKRE